MVDRNELWAETEELADLIIQSPEITRYRELEKNMKSIPGAVSQIERVRDLQEQIAEFRLRRVPETQYKHLVEESESLLDQLEMIPEVREFQLAQAAVNELLQAVSNHLSKAVLAGVSDEPCNCD